VAPWWWFPCKRKHVGAVFIILKCFNNSTFFNVVCMSWKIMCWKQMRVWHQALRITSLSNLLNFCASTEWIFEIWKMYFRFKLNKPSYLKKADAKSYRVIFMNLCRMIVEKHEKPKFEYPAKFIVKIHAFYWPGLDRTSKYTFHCNVVYY